MNTRTLLSIGTAMLVVGGTALGSAGFGGAAAEAGTRSSADLAQRAAKAVAKRDPAAVAMAEEAVAAAPGDAETRVLLGRAYLQAGRFASARDAFSDVLRLRPSDGRSALNLTLASIATGDWQGARTVLAAHRHEISATDYGLALALAGDPAGGAAILTQAARESGATAKTRQNLALTLALTGQWGLAKAVAAADMSPADVDKRIAEWAQFAQPTAASDQVASLLGVRAVFDRGQPVALALATPAVPAVPAAAPAPVMVAAAEPVVAPAPTPVAVAETAPVAPAVVPVVASPAMVAAVTFGPRREVVQPLPAPLIRADGPAKVSLAAFVKARAAQPVAKAAAGEWHVQLGAFANAGGARNAWGRISHRFASVGGHVPQGASYKAGSDALYRLSVGGFDHGGADRLCRSVRAGGGTCFVRRAAGDQVAQWARGGVQVASR